MLTADAPEKIARFAARIDPELRELPRAGRGDFMSVAEGADAAAARGEREAHDG